ncbi:hypothetical protein [Nocardia sp. NRRL S-836]|uniref:hypothetical protein n=1 Tax=Nocardia sp. NRRL S-836 TaxID=1519492 RepID=UPI0006AE4382|nr:hypothetical protein [Nocardia sp. NRRL S-836]KOV77257.1 hypothetical protein ADL03_41860 [Nocardia sp. NRRL S-836]
MDAEIVGSQARLTLSRSEVLLLLNVIVLLDGHQRSDVAYQEQVGHPREEVRQYADQLAELARSMPREQGRD